MNFTLSFILNYLIKFKGYAVAGNPSGRFKKYIKLFVLLNVLFIKDNCRAWYDQNNQNNRIKDGVIALTQANTFNPIIKKKLC